MQGCPSQLLEARLAQQMQTWVAAMVERRREISPPLLWEQQSGESWTGMAQGRYGTEIFFPRFLCGSC